MKSQWVTWNMNPWPNVTTVNVNSPKIKSNNTIKVAWIVLSEVPTLRKVEPLKKIMNKSKCMHQDPVNLTLMMTNNSRCLTITILQRKERNARTRKVMKTWRILRMNSILKVQRMNSLKSNSLWLHHWRRKKRFSMYICLHSRRAKQLISRAKSGRRNSSHHWRSNSMNSKMSRSLLCCIKNIRIHWKKGNQVKSKWLNQRELLNLLRNLKTRMNIKPQFTDNLISKKVFKLIPIKYRKELNVKSVQGNLLKTESKLINRSARKSRNNSSKMKTTQRDSKDIWILSSLNCSKIKTQKPSKWFLKAST